MRNCYRYRITRVELLCRLCRENMCTCTCRPCVELTLAAEIVLPSLRRNGGDNHQLMPSCSRVFRWPARERKKVIISQRATMSIWSARCGAPSLSPFHVPPLTLNIVELHHPLFNSGSLTSLLVVQVVPLCRGPAVPDHHPCRRRFASALHSR